MVFLLDRPAPSAFSAAGTFSHALLKKKTLCLFCKRQSVLKTLCGTTLGCRPLTEGGRSQPAAQADGITPVTRPRLLASSFSRRLQGDFHAPSLSAFHRHGGSFAGSDALLVLIYAIVFDYPTIISCFAGLSTAGVRIFFFFPAGKPSHSATSVSTAWRSVSGAAHISRENHVGMPGELAARVGLPHGMPGQIWPSTLAFSRPGRRCRWCWR